MGEIYSLWNRELLSFTNNDGHNTFKMFLVKDGALCSLIKFNWGFCGHKKFFEDLKGGGVHLFPTPTHPLQPMLYQGLNVKKIMASQNFEES